MLEKQGKYHKWHNADPHPAPIARRSISFLLSLPPLYECRKWTAQFHFGELDENGQEIYHKVIDRRKNKKPTKRPLVHDKNNSKETKVLTSSSLSQPPPHKEKDTTSVKPTSYHSTSSQPQLQFRKDEIFPSPMLLQNLIIQTKQQQQQQQQMITHTAKTVTPSTSTKKKNSHHYDRAGSVSLPLITSTIISRIQKIPSTASPPTSASSPTLNTHLLSAPVSGRSKSEKTLNQKQKKNGFFTRVRGFLANKKQSQSQSQQQPILGT